MLKKRLREVAHFLSGSHPMFNIITKTIWITFSGAIVIPVLCIWAVSVNLFGLFGKMPELGEIENPENDVSSEVISADGVTLGRYYRLNRSLVTFDQLSPDMVNTLVISEDHRFYQHSGIDLPAWLRVAKGIFTFSVGQSGGGSTLTQQLAKNLFTLNPSRSYNGPIAKLGPFTTRVVQKAKEQIIAVYLEKNFTKEEIIAMYLNTASFSYNAFGIKVASETYFSKSPAELNLQESALLVGMLQNPVVFNPITNPESALDKRNQVLEKLWLHGYKLRSLEQYDSIRQLSLDLRVNIQNHHKGLAPHFRTVIGNELKAWCAARNIDIWTAGLKIYTTIDSRLQRYAEEAVSEHLKYLQQEFDREWTARGMAPWTDSNGKPLDDFLRQSVTKTSTYKALAERYRDDPDSLKIMLHEKRPMTVFSWNGPRKVQFSIYDSVAYYKKFLHAGLMAMNPQTGYVKAWVGDIDHRYFQFDHVKQSLRQPGSTFKVFVYGLAMENGYSPCYRVPDISPVFDVNGSPWSPHNSGGDYGNGDELTLREGFARSKNTIAARLLKDLSAANVAAFARRLGISSTLEPVPSLCLGTSEVSLFEMVAAYSAFVNRGLLHEPLMVTRIEDKHGNILADFVPKTRQAISEQTAYKMVYLLKGGVEEEGGTSAMLNKELLEDNEVGGKTGTTDNASDGWYIGITPALVTGVWVGGEEPSIHFPTAELGQGARSALPVWEKFMLKAYSNKVSIVPKGFFKTPDEGLPIDLDCGKYK